VKPCLSFQEGLAKRLKTEEQDPSNEYINFNFILGSAAKVEHLWSIAGKVFPKDCTSKQHASHPGGGSGCYSFLRTNKWFWDKQEGLEAMKWAKQQEASAKYREHSAVAGDLEGPPQDI
jgi:hypothetical protein